MPCESGYARLSTGLAAGGGENQAPAGFQRFPEEARDITR
jgi:hypothetical protein